MQGYSIGLKVSEEVGYLTVQSLGTTDLNYKLANGLDLHPRLHVTFSSPVVVRT